MSTRYHENEHFLIKRDDALQIDALRRYTGKLVDSYARCVRRSCDHPYGNPVELREAQCNISQLRETLGRIEAQVKRKLEVEGILDGTD